jgi:nucleoside-diphosphate-sugar epimerase
MQNKQDKANPNLSAPLRGQGAVLITGGTGFIGAYIIQQLIEKGFSVRALRRSNKLPFFISKEILDKVEWVDGDVLDVVALDDAMKGVDAVIHSAAVVSFHKNDRQRMYNINVEGTANVVNLSIENGVKRFIHISSVAALGRTAKAELVNETKKWEENKHNTHYAISKHQAELHVWRGFAEGLDGVIINPSTVLGFGNWHQSSCALFKNGYKEFAWYTNGVNGFVGVDDVAKAVVQLLQSDINHQRFILSAENWSFKKLFNTIADGFGKKHPHKEATPALGNFVWRLEALRSLLTGSRPLLTKETARISHSKTSFDNTALMQALAPFQLAPLEEVIKNSCEKYKEAIRTGALTL